MITTYAMSAAGRAYGITRPTEKPNGVDGNPSAKQMD